jgi:hypothetical protein
MLPLFNVFLKIDAPHVISIEKNKKLKNNHKIFLKLKLYFLFGLLHLYSSYTYEVVPYANFL